jgi:catechol 2,3-dioxygenase-like lactoylglutathione lyase family enzyme
MNYSLHHVHLICKDLETMINFFKEAIGARFVEHRKFGTTENAMIIGGRSPYKPTCSADAMEIGTNDFWLH